MALEGRSRRRATGLALVCSLLLFVPTGEAALTKAEVLPEWLSPDNPAYGDPVSPGSHDAVSIHFVLSQPHNVSMRVFTPQGDFFRVLLFRVPYPAGDGYVQWDGVNDGRSIQAEEGTWPVGIYLEDEEGQQLQALVNVYVDRIKPKLNVSWNKTADDTPQVNVTALLDEEPPIPPTMNATFNGRSMDWSRARQDGRTWIFSKTMPEEHGRLIVNVTSADLAGNNATKMLRFLVIVKRPSTDTRPALIEVTEVPEGADWPPLPQDARRNDLGLWLLGGVLIVGGVAAAAIVAKRRRDGA